MPGRPTPPSGSVCRRWELRVSARFGFTYHQGYELELIEPRQGADFYARDLNPDGEIFLHHFGFVVRDLDL